MAKFSQFFNSLLSDLEALQESSVARLPQVSRNCISVLLSFDSEAKFKFYVNFSKFLTNSSNQHPFLPSCLPHSSLSFGRSGMRKQEGLAAGKEERLRERERERGKGTGKCKCRRVVSGLGGQKMVWTSPVFTQCSFSLSLSLSAWIMLLPVA